MRTAQQIARSLPFAYRADAARERFEAFEDALRRDDYMAALRTFDSFQTMAMELVTDVCQVAYNEGATKADLARALGVSPSMFRGMVAT